MVDLTSSDGFIVTDLVSKLMTLSHEAVLLFAEVAAFGLQFFLLIFQLTISFQLLGYSMILQHAMHHCAARWHNRHSAELVIYITSSIACRNLKPWFKVKIKIL